MLNMLDNFSYKLECHISPDDDTLVLGKHAIARLNELDEGDYVYLTLAWGHKHELVKYRHNTKLTGITIQVERDVESRGAKNFPRGSCVKMKWTKRMLKEFIDELKAVTL